MSVNKTIIALICVLLPTTSISFAKEWRTKVLNFEEHATIFEKYDKAKNLKEQKERLDAFALYLQENSHFQGYIISYGGRRACIGEAQARGEDAKNYLVNVKGIEANRLIIIDGGYYKEWMVELWAGARGALAPTPMPTVNSNEVRIIKNCNVRNNGSRLSLPRRKQRRPFQ